MSCFSRKIVRLEEEGLVAFSKNLKDFSKVCFCLVLLTSVLLLAACSAGAQSQFSPENVLTYATLYPDQIDRRAVNEFNRTHADIQIEVQVYSDENGQRGMDRLFTEMSVGQVPDIVNLTGLPYQLLAKKEYLEDLWPYIENDSELGRENVLDAPLKAAEIGGKLYTVFDYVCIDTLVGAESIVGDRYSWTLENLETAFAAMPEDSTILEYSTTKSTIFSHLFWMEMDNYLNWETGQVLFDSENFRSALEFSNQFPAKFNWTSDEEIAAETTERILLGRQMLHHTVASRLLDIQSWDTLYGLGGRASPVGYPVEDGSTGSSFYFTSKMHRLAMSSSCQKKGEAWEFIRMLLLPQYADKRDDQIIFNPPPGIPINRSDYMRLIQLDMSNAASSTQVGLYMGPERIPCHPSTKEELARFEEFINSIDKIQLRDNTLHDIVLEIVGAYFAGDKTLDDTVALVQNRATLYVNENR